MDDGDAAAQSLGHIDYKYYVDRFSDCLAQYGAAKEAVNVQDSLHKTLSARKVLDRVLSEIKDRRDSYKGKK